MCDLKIESEYSEEDLKTWSDEKLKLNIEAVDEATNIDVGDDYFNYENEVFLAGLLNEQSRREKE